MAAENGAYDLATLSELNERLILDQLKRRYEIDKIYVSYDKLRLHSHT